MEERRLRVSLCFSLKKVNLTNKGTIFSAWLGMDKLQKIYGKGPLSSVSDDCNPTRVWSSWLLRKRCQIALIARGLCHNCSIQFPVSVHGIQTWIDKGSSYRGLILCGVNSIIRADTYNLHFVCECSFTRVQFLYYNMFGYEFPVTHCR